MARTSRTSPFGTRKGVAEFDPMFNAPIVIDIGHHEVHEGDMFSVRHYDEDAASGHLLHIHLTTPPAATPQKRAHIVVEHESSGEHQYQLLEGVTRSSGGVLTTAINRQRGSAKAAVTTCYIGSDKGSNKVVYSGGTEIDGSYGGSGKQTGGGDRATVEWVLAPATEYLFILTAKAAGVTLDMKTIWYEHTDTPS